MTTSLPVTSLTPMMRQYMEVKAQHPEALLMYRMGDFFEMFFEDARAAAPILEVQLTARHKGTESEVPMCGVPHHALEGYLAKLLAAGLKVAICDQIEDPAQAKGLVKRAVTRVVTPGTVSDPSLLEAKEESFLAGLVWEGRGRGRGLPRDFDRDLLRPPLAHPGGGGGGPRPAAPPRGALASGDRGEEGFPREVVEWAERECPCRTPLEGDRLFDPQRAGELLLRQFGAGTLRGFGLEEGEPAVRAAAAALAYAQETQKSTLSHIRGLAVREAGDRLILDASTLANLEVFASQRGMIPATGRRKTTLLGVLDRTVTAPGGRTLREWLRRPLVDPREIVERHRAVGELRADNPRRERIREHLARMADPERLLTRAVLGTLTPREAAALRDALGEAPGLLAGVAAIHPSASPLLARLAGTDPLPELCAELARTLEAAPAVNLQEGGVIAAGVSEELDHYRSLTRDSKRHILALEVRERERTGIASLKIRYNKVFGYYLEVTRANQERVPADYIRKQTLVNAERYVTPELKELEEQILSAEERQVELEQRFFHELVEKIAARPRGSRRSPRPWGPWTPWPPSPRWRRGSATCGR